MTNKIAISRELAERIAKTCMFTMLKADYEELRALLAANPEENVACPQCGGSLRTWGCTCTPRWPMYKPEIAAPPVERQEPVGEVADMKYNRVQFYRATGDTSKPYLLPGTKLYTSPPAPVSLVLPERKDESKVLLAPWNKGWSACLDKAKEMNQSAAPGFTTVDVATADADGFSSGRKSLGLLFAPAFRTIEQKGGKYSVRLAFEDSADAWAAYEEITRAAELAVKE